MRRYGLVLLLMLCVAASGCRALFPSDGDRFEREGTPVGEALPEVEVYTLAGDARPLSAVWSDGRAGAGAGAVVIAVSRSCPVARYRMFDVRALAQSLDQRGGPRVGLVLLYTQEAHPDKDPSPYRADGKPWLTGFNVVQGVRIRQPQSRDARLAEARRFAQEHAEGLTVWCDAMANTGWDRLGRGPNTAVLIDGQGVVRARHGWFDGPTMIEAVETLLAAP